MPVAPASGFASLATGPDSAPLPGDWRKLGFDSDPLPGDPRVLQQIVEDFTFLRDTAWSVHQRWLVRTGVTALDNLLRPAQIRISGTVRRAFDLHRSRF